MLRLLKLPFSPLHDLIISPYVKQSQHNFVKKMFSALCEVILRKKSPHTLREGNTALSLHLFQFLKVSSLTFVTKNYNLAKKKQPSLLRFLKSYCIVMKLSCFEPELENHLAKTLYLGGKFVTNL